MPAKRPASRRAGLGPAYVAWRRAQDDATRAYAAWLDAAVEDRGTAFAGYHAALDQESAAAADLRRAGRPS
jgi:hypothetical protein